MTTKVPVELSSTPGIVDGSNATAITIDSSENVGIGVTPDSEPRLHVHKASAGSVASATNSVLTLENSTTAILQFLTPNSASAQIRFGDPEDTGAGYIQYGHSDNSLQFSANGPEKMRITASGKLAIGTDNPDTGLHLSGSDNTASTLTLTNTAPSPDNTWTFTPQYNSGDLTISDDGTERMRIASAGNFRIGTSNDMSSKFGIADATNQITFTVDQQQGSGFDKTVIDSASSQNGGSYHFYNAHIRGVANKFRVAQDGNVTNTNNSYGSISDQRLKTDIADASSQWDDIKALKVRKFKLGMQPDDGFKIGVVSQELEASGMNGLVQEKDADEYHIAYNSDLKDQKVKEVKYSVLYMKAIKALQEAMTRIETLETKVKTLEDA